MSKNAVCYTVIVICLFTSACFAKYSGGTGDPNDPYLLATPNDLNSIGADSNDWDKHFKMIADVNLAQYSGETFNRIGTFQREFKGTFDGNEHTITNFNWSIASSYDRCIGVFGVVGHEGHVRNVILEDVDVNALPSSDFVGALVGYNDAGLILGCSVSGRILGSGNVGGLVGYNDSGTIADCHSAVTVSGDRYGVGGLVGIDFTGGDISYCSATGDVTGEDDCVGGLIGSAERTHIYKCFATGDVQSTGNRYCTGGLIGDVTSCSIENCYAVGNVSGNKDVGGLLGNYYSSIARIVNCYSTGRVVGNDSVGAFIGEGVYNINCDACFWDTDTNPDVNAVSNKTDPNIIGLPTAEMQKHSTFADAGWDMINVWDIGENQTYPFLRMHLPSDINKDDETNFLDLAILTENWLGEK